MTPFWTSSGRFSRLLSHTELRSVFPRKHTSGSGTSSKRSSRILTSASSAMSGFCGLPVPSFFMASGAHHVVDGYEPPRARAFDRGEVYPQLLRSTPGGVCGPRLLSALLLASSGLLGRLPHGLLSLLGCLSGGVLSLARYLSDLIGGLSRCLLCLARHLTGGVLGLLGCSSRGVLYLLNRLSGGILCSLRGLSGGTVLRDFGLLLAGPVTHRLGRLYHVHDDDTSVGARALDLREVHAQLPCLAPGRVRCFDLPLTPDLVRVQVGDVLLRLADTVLHCRVVVHQLLKQHLEGFFSPPRNLVRQVLQRGTVLFYLLL